MIKNFEFHPTSTHVCLFDERGEEHRHGVTAIFIGSEDWDSERIDFWFRYPFAVGREHVSLSLEDAREFRDCLNEALTNL